MEETEEKIPRPVRGSNVCVVGGAGFLGSHLVNHLIEDRSCSVLVLDNLITGQRKFVHPKANFLYCDITDSESRLRKIFEFYKIEYVFNYAAEPYIPVSFERPLHVFDINARGALMVINAAHDAGVKGILQVSSAEIYGDAGPEKIAENHPTNPHSSYGASKLAIDSLVQARYMEAGTPAISLRQFNCVGERETHWYVVPEIISQVSKSTVIKLGNNSFRDFLYAGDAVRMAVELLERGNLGEVYNMGSEEGIEIYELAEMVGMLSGNIGIEVEVDSSRVRPWEIWHLQSDNSKLYRTIPSRPAVSLKDALSRTIKYFEDNGSKWDF